MIARGQRIFVKLFDKSFAENVGKNREGRGLLATDVEAILKAERDDHFYQIFTFGPHTLRVALMATGLSVWSSFHEV